MTRPALIAVATAMASLALAGCHDAPKAPVAGPAATTAPVSTPTTAAASPTPRPRPAVTHRVVAPAAFTWSSAQVSAADLGKSWHSGCPIGPASLRTLTLTFWGFDARAHTGRLVVNASVVTSVVQAFRTLYVDRFPIRRMAPTAAYGGDDNASMAADNTSAFNCRYAVANGPKSWSMHAFGEAIDIDTVENPYTLDGRVYPPQGKPYTDRSDVRAGMIVRRSVPVRAFTAVGWGWGGNWSSSPDYQHFSVNGK